MTSVRERLQQVMDRIRSAEQRYGRPQGSVTLLAVSKLQPASAIAELAAAGQYRFGENYLQEAEPKMQALSGLALEWHFIGPIQANKTRGLACHFAWVHSVDRFKIARRLSEQRPGQLSPLNICLQVNISGEASKSGIEPARLSELATVVADLPRLQLRGLMAIPAPSDDFTEQRRACARLRQYQEALQAAGFALDTLSMGMSADLEAAIAEGATLVRIGTAIFGPRPVKAPPSSD